ncbi:MAG: hypothetical protein DBX61_07130 [Clostridiales bacterium]|nr:LysR family transcriptional regulator [Ruminococcus sp.]PWM66638.1 MAG: hypothetical protein DBX61_07130 [Clostridiales bacterium]
MAEDSSFAAEKLNYTQSTITFQIDRLEKSYQFQYLYKTNKIRYLHIY